MAKLDFEMEVLDGQTRLGLLDDWRTSASYLGCEIINVRYPKLTEKDDWHLMRHNDWFLIGHTVMQCILGSRFHENHVDGLFGVCFSKNRIEMGRRMDLSEFSWTHVQFNYDVKEMHALCKHLSKYLGDDEKVQAKWRTVLRKTKKFLKANLDEIDEKLNHHVVLFVTNQDSELTDEVVIAFMQKVIKQLVDAPKFVYLNEESECVSSFLLGGAKLYKMHEYLSYATRKNVVQHYSKPYVSIRQGDKTEKEIDYLERYKDLFVDKNGVKAYSELSNQALEQVQADFDFISGHPVYKFAYNAGGKLVQDWFTDLAKAFDVILGKYAKLIKMKNPYKNYNDYHSAKFLSEVGESICIGFIDSLSQCNDEFYEVDAILQNMQETQQVFRDIQKILAKQDTHFEQCRKAGIPDVAIQSALELLQKLVQEQPVLATF